MTDLTALTWPAARLGEALEALARAAGMAPRAVEPLNDFGLCIVHRLFS